MHRRVLAATCLVGMMTAASPAAAGLYRTRDARGRTVITNLPAERARPLSGGTLSVATVPGGEAPRLRLYPAAPAIDRRREPYRAHLMAAAARYTLPVRLLEAVVAVESGFNPKATSKKGAQGLMQLMPGTARELAVKDAYDPAENIDGGARYLRRMLDLFNQDVTLALAAYNAGPNAVLAAGGVPLIAETVEYVRKVRSLYHGGTLTYGSSSLRRVRTAGGGLLLTNVGSTPGSLRRPAATRPSAPAR